MKEKTKIHLRTLILTFAIFNAALFTVPQLAHADVSSILRGQICEPDTDGVDSGYNIGRCINNIYIFAVSIAGFIAVLMFVLAGYNYITGTSESISEAKKIMGSTLLGLVILFSTYIILNTVDPNLTKMPAIVAPQVNCNQVSVDGKTENICADLPDQLPYPVDANGNPVGLEGGKIVSAGSTIQAPANNNNLPAGTKTIQPCVNCIDLTQGLTVHVKKTTNAQRVQQYYLNKDLTQRLVNMVMYFANLRAELARNIPYASKFDWYITEAWPPTVKHSSDCHFNGNCADIAIMNRGSYSDGQLLVAVKTMCTAAKKTGLKFANEYYEFTAQQFAGSDCGNPQKFVNTNVGHLHVSLDANFQGDPDEEPTAQ